MNKRKLVVVQAHFPELEGNLSYQKGYGTAGRVKLLLRLLYVICLTLHS
jgi:hypothetical protein